MRSTWLAFALLVLCAAFAMAQSDTQSTTTGTQTTTTTTNAQEPPASTGSTANTPEGTHVTEHQRDTLVQPVNKPVKVTPSVVKAAQKKLQDDGYDPGPVDALMGPKTRAAIRSFQAKNGLDETGNLDQPTLAKLNVGGTQEIGSAPSDIGRGGKAFGHDIKGGHPVAAGKAMAQGSENFGKKVGQGTKSEAVNVKHGVGKGLSKIGNKVEGKKADNSNPQ